MSARVCGNLLLGIVCIHYIVSDSLVTANCLTSFHRDDASVPVKFRVFID